MTARRARRRRSALLRRAACCIVVACAAQVAFAEPPRGALVPELRLGAGYDDNVFLDAFPVGPLATAPRADAIFDVEPRLHARVGKGGHAFTLTIDDLERFTISSGHLRDLDVALGYKSAPLGRVELFAGLGWAHWDATLYPDNRNEAGFAQVAARVAIAGPVEGVVALRGAVRAYPARDQLDGEARPSALVRVRLPRRLAFEGSYAFLHLASTEPRAALDRHSIEAALVGRPLDWLGLRVSYALSGQTLPAGTVDAAGLAAPRRDLRHGARVALSATPLRWLEVFLEYDLLWSTSTDPLGDYRRNQVLAGVSAYGVFATELRRSQAPQVEAGRVTFRWRGKAQRVSVVGDWNGWDADAAPLRADHGGYTGTYDLPPGRHLYSFSVDGVIVAPADAPTYAPDGFGGHNGVLVIR